MRLKGRILITLFIVMLLPVVLTSFFYVIIFRSRFNYDKHLNDITKTHFNSISNSVTFIYKLTDEDYHRLLSWMEKGERVSNMEAYLEETQGRLKKKYTDLFWLEGKEDCFCKNKPLYEELEPLFSSYSKNFGRVSEFYRHEEKTYLIRGFIKKDAKGSVSRFFMVSDIQKVDEDSKKALSEVFSSLVFSVLITAVLLALWLNRYLIRPINDLKAMTKRIVKGDLETEIKCKRSDEVGELCKDFDDMRIHIKSLLEQNNDTENAMREMMANFSHDLRTPLTAIKGYTMGLVDGVATTPEKQTKYLRIIDTKADEMNVLIEELSAFAKLDMNSVPYHFMKIKIHDYLEGVIRSEKNDFEIQRFQISYERNIREDVFVWIDPSQINKVLSNIFSNIKKYRKANIPGKVILRSLDAGEFVKIEIEDNGQGIKAEHLPHLFERFYRIDGSRNTKSGGSGLGLAIVKKIIEKHQGKIELVSEFGVGTTIRIFIKKYHETTSNLEGNDDEQDTDYRR